MKYLPIAMLALLCACQTTAPLTLQQQQAATAALGKKTKQSAEGQPEAPITKASRFAAKCPYCDHVCFSKSCLPNGYTTAEGKNVQTWGITYSCSGCGMMFGDTKKQVIDPVQSIRVPIGQ